MTNTIATYLKYANLQLAAEALFEFNPQLGSNATPGSTASYETIPLSYLVNGNNRSSKFPDVLAADFAANWTVVEHKANTATGFSGTLFKYTGPNDEAKGLINGELVLSFRSTEFADDAVRDNQATNTLEIKEKGWAFGQIADMENWFASLKLRDKIPAGASYSVTGYSLGGHLATAFNLLRQGDGTKGQIAGTYTFNGAGVGQINNLQSLNNLIADFDRLRKNVSGNEIVFTTPDAQALYAELRPAFGAAGASLGSAFIRSEAARIEQMRTRSSPIGVTIYLPTQRNAELGMLQTALERIAIVQAEAERVATLPSGNGNNPQNVQGPANIEALRLDYQLAVLKASEQTWPSAGVVGGAYQAIAGRNTVAPPIAGFYDIYGSDFGGINYSAVANSQRHYGVGTPVFIEDQPLFRGTVLQAVGTETWKAGDVKLLVPNFVQNDFGDTHSLVLLVDSLAVQNALVQLDPGASQATLAAVLRASANHKAKSNVGEQGTVDGDTLENLVNTLGAYLGVDATAEGWVKLKGNLVGGTWAEVNSVGDYTGRAALHKNLELIAKDPDYQDLMGKVTLQAATAGLAQDAKSDFGALVALQTLSPFVLKAKAGVAGSQGSLDELWADAWSDEYTLWQADKTARLAGQAAPNYTDTWLADRANFLKWSVARNNSNVEEVRAPGITLPVVYSDVPSSTLFSVANTNTSPQGLLQARRVIFGGAENDALLGGTEGDHLYGGGGADTLEAKAGADYLEGNAGNDNLIGGEGDDSLIGGAGDDNLNGGAGTDSYIIEGKDTITDSDRLGSLTDKLGNRIAGLINQKIDGSYVFLSNPAIGVTGAGADITLTLAGGDTVTLKDFGKGMLGLNLNKETTPAPVSFSRTIVGDLAPADENPEVSGIQEYRDDIGNIAVSSQVEPDRIDWVSDSEGNDDIRLLGGDDYIGGLGGGNDRFDGGTGNDRIFERITDSGTDTLIGGPGMDFLFAMDGEDRLYADAEVTLELALAAQDGTGTELKGDAVGGGEGNDLLVGSDGIDLLLGGRGNDLILAGASGDVVRGDAESNVADWDWSVERTLSLNTDGSFNYVVNYPGMFFISIADQVTAADDIILAGAGADWVFGEYGNDYIDGGNDDDFLVGGEASDQIFGGSGNDALSGDGTATAIVDHGSDYLDGGAGNDVLNGDGGSDQLYGGTGNDRLLGDYRPEYAGSDYLDGGAGDDDLSGMAQNDQLFGGAGDDRLSGGDGADDMHGGDGADVMVGDNGLENASGAADAMYGDAGNDHMEGQAGDDVMDGGEGNDLVIGDAGSDQLFGGMGDDQLQGGDGSDALSAGEGNNSLFGQAGDDSLEAGSGNDYIDGGLGNDTLAGGDGDDVYHYKRGDGVDRIADASGNDRLILEGITWQELVLGTGSLKLSFAGGEIHLDDFDPDDPLASGGIEIFQFAGGVVLTREQLINALGMKPTGTAGADTVRGTALADTISALEGDDLVLAAAGADTVDGGAGNDTLFGGAGNDQILGGIGADTLLGQEGNDRLDGGAGDDTYLFEPGGGIDVVVDASGQNRIVVGADRPTLGMDAVQFSRLGDDLVVAIAGTADQLTVRGWFGLSSGFTDVSLGDGTVLDRAAVERATFRNSAPEPVADSATVKEDGSLIATGNALANDRDPEGRTLRITDPGSYAGAAGTLTIEADGTYKYVLDNGSSTVQGLSRGIDLIERFAYTVSDDEPAGAATAESTITVTVRGSDELLVLADDRASITEDGTTVGGNVLNNDHDVGPALSVFNPTTYGAMTYGWIAMNSQGDWTYTLDWRKVQALAVGQTVKDSWEYGVLDSSQESAQQKAQLEITIVGQNDAPILMSPSVDQMVTPNTRWVWSLRQGNFHDWDNGDELTYSATLANGAALPSWLTFDAATQTFSGDVPPSASGEIAIRMAATDRSGASASDVFALKFSGANQAPIASPDFAIIMEDGRPSDNGLPYVTGSVRNNDFDPEGRFLEVILRGRQDGNFGALYLSGDGGYVYILKANGSAEIQQLGVGDSVVDRFFYVVTDNDPRGAASAVGEFVVTIRGTNDLPVLGADSLAIHEDDVAAITGNVLANDHDVDANTSLAVLTTGDIAGTYGALTMGPDGNWSYALGNASGAVQRLIAGQKVTDTFHFDVSDGDGALVAGSLAIEITGQNDAPILANPLSDMVLVANSSWTWGLPGGSFTDIDNGDVLTYSAKLASGAAVPSWLTFDAATQTFAGLAPTTAAGIIDIQVTATDTSGAAASDVFALTINATKGGNNGGGHGNEGVGNGPDAPPPGHDTNHNDGPGTGPGNPGSGGGKKDAVAPTEYVLSANLQNLTLTGTDAANGTGNELNNVIAGNAAANRLRGLGGNDTLSGGAGNDTLEGGAGADLLNGGLGADIYRFGRGDGFDTLTDVDTTGGVQDMLQISGGIAADQLWPRKVDNNLEISVIGTGDKVLVADWYSDTSHHVEVLQLANGQRLLDSQVQNLVQAMASFAPPPAGQTTLLPNYQSALGGVIAANWQ